MKDKKRILVVCPFPQGVAAGQRLKYEQYFHSWRENGYEVVVSPFMDSSMWSVVYARGNLGGKLSGVIRGYFRRLFDIFRLPRYDLVYIFMWVTPIGSSLFERIFRSLAKKVIFDIEDNVPIEKKK